MRKLLICAALFVLGQSAHAQFGSGWLERSDYWNDGKAELNVYRGTVVRYDEPRESEVMHILVREPFGPEALVKTDNWQQPGAYPVLKLNQILRIPTGIYVYQQMHTSFWKLDGTLIKLSLTSNDSCGNTFKIGERRGEGWTLRSFTYWEGMEETQQRFTPPGIGVFYDELPMRVRTIDFSRGDGEFSIQLAPTVIHSKARDVEFKPATVRHQKSEEGITVTIAHEAGTDELLLAPDFPHLLLRWKSADGGELRLQHSLKIDYWRYNKPGDREKALADPSLRLWPKPSSH